jgi:hypothetical protein
VANGEEAFIESLREDGVMDWVKDRMEEGLGHESPEAEASTTDDQPRDPETGQFVSAEETEAQTETEEPVVEETEEHPEDLESQDEDEMYLDLTPELEEFIAKHGGLEKALQTGMWADSVRGRQGNELGDLKKQLDELRQVIEARPTFQPSYAEWPDEMDEPEVAVPRYRLIAEQAFQNEDVNTMQDALSAWQEVDPLGAEAYAALKTSQLILLQAGQQRPAEQTTESTVEDEFARLEEKYPDIKQHGEAIAAEAERWPTLARRLQEGTPSERVQALEDLYLEAQRRSVNDNAEEALRRVRIRQSEEARRVRQDAQVATGGGNRVIAEQKADRVIDLGDTGKTASMNRVNELIEGSAASEFDVMRGGRLGRIVDGKFVPSS